MRLSAKTRLLTATGLAAAVAVVAASPAFADYSIIAVDRGTGQVGVAIAGCGTTEVAYKPVVVPAVGAAVANTDATEAGNAAFLLGMQTGKQPADFLTNAAGSGAGAVSMGAATAKRGTAVLAKGAAAATPTTKDPKGQLIFSADNPASADVSTSATKAFNEAKGVLAQKLAAALVAAEKAGGDAGCSGKATTAAVLVGQRGDSLYNAYQWFKPSDAGTNAVALDNPNLPSVFITTLTKSGSNAVDKLNALTAKADFTKAVRLRNNAVQDQANLLKFALLSFVGAALAVTALVFYRRRMRAAAANETSKRNQRSGNPANS